MRKFIFNSWKILENKKRGFYSYVDSIWIIFIQEHFLIFFKVEAKIDQVFNQVLFF